MRIVWSCILGVALQWLPPYVSPVLAEPLQHAIILAANRGGAFGATAPASFYGSFQVDSSFLDNADGSYPGNVVSGFLLGIGTQAFDQATAAAPNIQGVTLANHTITAVAMNFAQTSGGATLQTASDGSFVACTDPGCSVQLSGSAGSQDIQAVRRFLPRIVTPEVRGDQLIFFYDARTNRTPFLSVTNPANSPVTVEVVFYPSSLAARLGQEVITLPAAGNAIIDPTTAAGGVAEGNAGLAIVTPIQSASTPQAIVPPKLLCGNFTLANLALMAAFGENPIGRLALTGSGDRGGAGQPVDGQTIKYQTFQSQALIVPAYFNPQTLAPPQNDGNRIILAAFADNYGEPFNLSALPEGADGLQASFFDNTGQLVAQAPLPVTGVFLGDLQGIAGQATLSSSGKVFFAEGPLASNESLIGIFSQSAGTFASGQRMPGVDAVPTVP